jgi:hypothetical protein
MHYCQSCKKMSKPNETANKAVVETRKKVYNELPNNARRRTPMSFMEIVREIVICAKCAANTNLFKKVGNTLLATSDVQLISHVEAHRGNA